MCIGRLEERLGAASTSADTSTLNRANTDVTSSPLAWTRTFRQPMKPMLPRKLTSSARINLNQYWNILEELVHCDISMDIQDGGENFVDDFDMSNEINENLANERLEQSRDLHSVLSTCQSADVDIAVSLDNCTLCESPADIHSHKISDSS
ncbi:uncharacterized protein [Periplaneta americana]|uniref:uncharacterized protein n=1 Tax=Periplaneta americana TaxID=6978 RepID=UPI0037E98EA5